MPRLRRPARDRSRQRWLAVLLSAGLLASASALSGAGTVLADPIFDPPPADVAVPPVADTTFGEFRVVTAKRILDTRSGLGGPSTKIGSGRTRTVDVTGVGGIPASGVSAVVLNVTVKSPTRSGFVSLYPSGASRPSTYNVNFAAGRTISNLVTVKVGSGGTVKLYNSAGSSHVIIAVAGWYRAHQPGQSMAGATYFRPLTAKRILDTRSGLGGPSTKIGSGRTRTVDVTGVGGIPASGVSAVVLNVTVKSPTRSGFVSLYPSGASRPSTYNVNFAAGRTISNLVTVKVGSGGTVKLYNSAGSSHVIIAVAGWYGGSGAALGGQLSPLTAKRILDTRSGLGGPSTKIGSGRTRTVDVTGVGGIPASGVSAVVLNVTVKSPTRSGFVSLYPSGASRPSTYNVNFAAGRTISNLVTVKVGSGGTVKLYNSAGSSHVIIAVAGWYTVPGHDPEGAAGATQARGSRSADAGRSPDGRVAQASTSTTGFDLDGLKLALAAGRVRVAAGLGDADVAPGLQLEPLFDVPNLTTSKWDYVRTTITPAIGRLYKYDFNSITNEYYLIGFCSASVVSRVLVVTAGHCVYGRGASLSNPLHKFGGFLYIGGQYGDPPAAGRWWSTYSWVDAYYQANVGFSPLDYAFIEFKPEQNGGLSIGDSTGTFPVLYDSPGGAKWSYGYPSEGYFGSEPNVGTGGCSNRGIDKCFPVYCNSPIDGPQNYRLQLVDANASYGGWFDVGIGCPMTGGASGGPIFEQFNGAWHVSGVNSYVDPGATYACVNETRNNSCFAYAKNLWSPYFNGYFAQIYNDLVTP